MDMDDTIKALDANFTQMEAMLEGNQREMGDQDETNEKTIQDPPPSILHLTLFETLSQAQSAHGIPLQDYEQYQNYCTKRLYRIRHHKDVRSQLVHSNKYGKQQQQQQPNSEPQQSEKKTKTNTGGRHAFCPRPNVPENGLIRHEYILWNLFFQAERAWAQACSLQTVTNSNQANVKKAKLKSRMMSRLNKAVHWCRALEDAVEHSARTSKTTQREVHSYLMWMLGNQQLQRQEYAAAFRFYNTSRSILLELANQSTSMADVKTELSNDIKGEETTGTVDAKQLAMADVWTNRANELLLPLIRFCQYEAKDEELAPLDEAQTTSFSATKKDGGLTLEFRNLEISLDSYPPLAVLYLKLEKRLAPKDTDNIGGDALEMSESDFLQILSDLDDALRYATEEAQRYNNLPDGPAVQTKRRELSNLKAYFHYHKLALQRQHQEERLAGEENIFTADPAEMLHVYEALLQNAQAMADLNRDRDDDPDTQRDPYNPEDDPFWLEAQAHVVRIRAVRCYQLARLYESPLYLAGTTTAEVLALLQQCTRLQRRAVEEVGACDFSNGPAEETKCQAQLAQLKLHVQGMTVRVLATRFLEQQDSEASSSHSSKATNRPLWLRLKELDAGTVLVDQDPSPLLLPLPCKPVFYDVAYEHVTETQDSLDMLEQYIAQNEPEKKSSGGGLFGWFSSSK